jgi:hypothetical protein
MVAIAAAVMAIAIPGMAIVFAAATTAAMTVRASICTSGAIAIAIGGIGTIITAATDIIIVRPDQPDGL